MSKKKVLNPFKQMTKEQKLRFARIDAESRNLYKRKEEDDMADDDKQDKKPKMTPGKMKNID